MQTINMLPLNYDYVDDLTLTFLPCEIDMLIRGIECYMFIFHNIYSSTEDYNEKWTRDFIAMNLYNKLAATKGGEFKTKYDVVANAKKHAEGSKRVIWKAKYDYRKKSA